MFEILLADEMEKDKIEKVGIFQCEEENVIKFALVFVFGE